MCFLNILFFHFLSSSRPSRIYYYISPKAFGAWIYAFYFRLVHDITNFHVILYYINNRVQECMCGGGGWISYIAHFIANMLCICNLRRHVSKYDCNDFFWFIFSNMLTHFIVSDRRCHIWHWRHNIYIVYIRGKLYEPLKAHYVQYDETAKQNPPQSDWKIVSSSDAKIHVDKY